jgi:hypothetical protein
LTKEAPDHYDPEKMQVEIKVKVEKRQEGGSVHLT